MDKSDEGRRYKWSSLATNLLVSIWSHNMVQNQLRVSSRNQPIWESIARYMTRRGFPVTGLQCRTRIKNMLCTYQEAKRKNDPNGFKPYFDVFKKVLSGKQFKKIDGKPIKTRRHKISEESIDEVGFDQNSNEAEQCVSDNAEHCEYEMEFLNLSNQEAESSSSVNMCSTIQQLENAIVKAIDSQTKTITTAIKMQSQMIQKILTSEKERLELILASERETKKNIENKLNKLLCKFEIDGLPQITYVGSLIENSHINSTSN